MIVFRSELRINRRHPMAQLDLRDRNDLHRSLLSAFLQPMPPDEHILYRVESVRQLPYVTVLVQSLTWPEWEKLEHISGPGYLYQAPAIRTVDFQFNTGLRLRFCLHANPTMKCKGKRRPLFGERNLARWLGRKSTTHGFAVEPLDVKIVRLGELHGKGGKQTWHVVRFQGVLEVVEPEAFTNALRYGIGSAKRFGFGLLSVRYLAGFAGGSSLAA